VADKELFLQAFRGEATERPPAWEQAFASDVASEILGRQAYTGTVLLHYQEAVAGVRGEAAHEEFLEQVEEDRVAVARELRWSAINFPWLRGRPTKQVDEYTFLYGDEDGEWVAYRFDPDACTYGPVAYARPPIWRSEEEIKRQVENAWQNAEKWQEETRPLFEERVRRWLDLAGEEFVYVAGAGGLSVPLNEEWMVACAFCPQLVAEYLDAQVAVGLQTLDVLGEFGVRVVNGGGDLASKNGPLYGPKFFHDIVMPRYKRIIDRARSYDIYYIFRSDGDLWSIADMIFGEAAAPAFNEIDYDSGMHIPELQERFPELTCVGNVPCPLLRDGEEQDVRAFVRELMQKVLPRGRWVVASANAVLPGTPVRNVIAMLEEAKVL